MEAPSAVYQKLQDRDPGVRWLVTKLADDKKSLTTVGSGTDWDTFVSCFTPDECMWGVFAVHGVDVRNSVTSTRLKPIQVNWVGPNVKAMQRAKAIEGGRLFGSLAKGIAVSVDAEEQTDLDRKQLAVRIADCGGAHKPSHYDFGNGLTISLADIGKAVPGDAYGDAAAGAAPAAAPQKPSAGPQAKWSGPKSTPASGPPSYLPKPTAASAAASNQKATDLAVAAVATNEPPGGLFGCCCRPSVPEEK
eukprot:CAMPEP_0204308124 /NCGR_PEP_ID=MMETSP0469-20131031/315_1 /ASSEMBLY_ACC=CAM_ASM_000384 /TAXON_ID=2969 /ORGANISM="Oxyrrhis marina" /LENGTH=247 /DNA_ID=CAMNT_0051287549 /DNA_START=17 /DNA_END=760 /DNA_ORIENTATION=+